ncbi:MAG TPA: hypothetical protein VF339_06250 [Gammaproteobacteria bacterium]
MTELTPGRQCSGYPYERGACCDSCYIAHQRLRPPYIIWCPHHARVVRVVGRRSFVTWPLTETELLEIVRSRSSGESDR